MKEWQVILTSNAAELPAQTAGVYLLFCGKTLDYAGQSDDVRRRLTQPHHVYDPAVHTIIAMIQAPVYDERLALERYFNQKYNPANSYVGSEKQAGNFDARFLELSAEQRRAMWRGPAFDEFDLTAFGTGETVSNIVLSAGQLTLNRMQAPSVLTLPPEELLGF